MKPRIFIGSSAEGLIVAHAIQQNLQHDAYCDVWTQSIFGLGKTTIHALLNAVTDHDFGVFVLSPDDVQIVDSSYSAARDNVVLESALFMGRYAYDRAYLVKPMNVQDFRIPTDLLGLTMAEYDPAHLAVNAAGALGTASNQIRSAIRTDPSYTRTLSLNVSFKRQGLNYPLKLWLKFRNQTGINAVIKSNHFRCKAVLRAPDNAIGDPATQE